MGITAKVTTNPEVKTSLQNNSVSKTVGVQRTSKVQDSFSIDASEIPVSLDNSTATNVRDALNGNLEVDNIKAATVVVESEGISSNDNDATLPTSAAVKDFAETRGIDGGAF